MKRVLLLLTVVFCTLGASHAQNIVIGERAPELKSVTWLASRNPAAADLSYLVFFHSSNKGCTASLDALRDLSNKLGSKLRIIIITQEDHDADPEVDAMLFRFWTEGEYGWINIDSAGDTGLPSDSLVIGVQLEYEDEAGLKIIAQTGDPYFLIVPASDMGEYFSLADYPVLKIRMRNETPSTVGELFINRSGANNVTADDEIQYDITANDTEFKEYIIDLKELMGEEAFEKFGMQTDTTHISITDSELEQELGVIYDPVCIAVPYSAPNQENAVKWIKSLDSRK